MRFVRPSSSSAPPSAPASVPASAATSTAPSATSSVGASAPSSVSSPIPPAAGVPDPSPAPSPPASATGSEADDVLEFSRTPGLHCWPAGRFAMMVPPPSCSTWIRWRTVRWLVSRDRRSVGGFRQPPWFQHGTSVPKSSPLCLFPACLFPRLTRFTALSPPCACWLVSRPPRCYLRIPSPRAARWACRGRLTGQTTSSARHGTGGCRRQLALTALLPPRLRPASALWCCREETRWGLSLGLSSPLLLHAPFLLL